MHVYAFTQSCTQSQVTYNSCPQAHELLKNSSCDGSETVQARRQHSLNRRRWMAVTRTQRDPARADWRAAHLEVNGRRREQNRDTVASASAEEAQHRALEQDTIPPEDSFPAPRPRPSGRHSHPCCPWSSSPRCSGSLYPQQGAEQGYEAQGFRGTQLLFPSKRSTWPGLRQIVPLVVSQ